MAITPQEYPEFLEERDGALPWTDSSGAMLLTPQNTFYGNGASPLEVAVATAPQRPTDGALRKVWSARQGRSASPLLLAVIYPGKGEHQVALCGPAGETPFVRMEFGVRQAEALATEALDAPDRRVATLRLNEALQQDQELPGMRNVGMFASHELKSGVPRRSDWTELQAAGARIIGLRGKDLVEALGFTIEPKDRTTHLLRIRDSGRATAIAVLLDRNESPEAASARFPDSSPVSFALARADQENLDYVVLTHGSQIRVYSARRHAGVGRRGRTETYVEADLTMLPDSGAGYLPLLFGAHALEPGGTFEEVLDNSKNFAADLGEKLRERVYNEVVPRLSTLIGQGLARHRKRDLAEDDLPYIYEMAMTVLFRLLFIAYGEDKGLLPYRSSEPYRRHALKTLARELADQAADGAVAFDPASTSHWDNVRQLFTAVDQGNTEWSVPRYNGGLFTSEKAKSEVGHEIAQLKLTNAEFGPALAQLVLDVSADGEGPGPVDFRALSVREFGTIYEGLLESSLSLAATDLKLDRQSRYVVASEGDDVVVRAGEAYLQNQSGERKATGSYFTKQFAVEHLLEKAFDPAIDRHLAQVKALLGEGKEADAARLFFAFRCADLAMGSAHFLVGAVDHIEARFSTFLALNPIRNVQADLSSLRNAAREALGDLADTVEIENASLLRRQIARRCIYGADVNKIAVELSKLAIWIHTFVPGLPLSFLDHNLVHGNSLTGIGTLEEAVGILDPDSVGKQISTFQEPIEASLATAREALVKLARVSEARADEVQVAYAAHQEAKALVADLRDLFDLLVAHRINPSRRQSGGEYVGLPLPHAVELDRSDRKVLEGVRSEISALMPLHFPLEFPEVFSGENPGFHCFLGNPPWEEVTVEEDKFWNRHFPGYFAARQAERGSLLDRYKEERPDLTTLLEEEVARAEVVRRALVVGPFPGMGTGDPDLYKAFTWRFWTLARRGGSIGVVLPRSALVAAGSAGWRAAILEGGEFANVTMLLNRAGWVFDEAEHRYTIGLVVIEKGLPPEPRVRIQGPFSSMERYLEGRSQAPAEFPVPAFRAASAGDSFPLLPSPDGAAIFLKMLEQPRLGEERNDWCFRPVAELHATNDKKQMDFAPRSTEGMWPVYKGASFDLWNPDTGVYYAWADPAAMTDTLQAKRVRQQRTASSAFSAQRREWAADARTLPCTRARIAFRDITRATDTRTVRIALLPPQRVLTNKAPYLLRVQGNAADEAYLLGVLSSVPLDWYARRVVEISMNFHILNGFPVPAPTADDPRRLRVVEIAGRLAAVDGRFAEWAAEVGVPVGSVAPEEKDDLLAELDALAAHLYGLSAEQVTHIFETFHEGWDYSDRLAKVLAHFAEITDA